MKDFLIVGLGYCGLHFSHLLKKRSLSYHVIDPCLYNSASYISGGIVNPLAGRNYALQWHIDALLQKSSASYSEIEKLVHSSFVQQYPILKIHKNEDALNAWNEKKNSEELKKYTSDFLHTTLHNVIHAEHGYITINHAYQVDALKMFAKYINYLEAEQQIIKALFDASNLGIHTNYFEYNSTHYKHVIFCDGIAAMLNTFFNFIPFKPDKGECLIVEIHNLPETYIYIQGIILIPLGNSIFWAGATHTWNDLSPLATAENKKILENQLHDLLKVPYTVLDQKAAVRPTVRDRTPVLGKHPTIQNMFVLNGMGTKGVLLSPYYAEILADAILFNKPIEKNVNVNRFYT